MCVKLLAETNVNFEQKENRYIAQIRIDPNKLQNSSLSCETYHNNANISNAKK